MNTVIRIVGALVAAAAISIALTFVFSPSAQAASKPKLAATGAIWAGDDGQGGTVAKTSVRIYAKNRFKVKNGKELRRLANAYRPKNVVLQVKGKKGKMTQVSELMPEFVFPFFGAIFPGLDASVDYNAKVSFRNKANGKQTLKVKLIHEEPEPPADEEEDTGDSEDDIEYCWDDELQEDVPCDEF